MQSFNPLRFQMLLIQEALKASDELWFNAEPWDTGSPALAHVTWGFVMSEETM